MCAALQEMQWIHTCSVISLQALQRQMGGLLVAWGLVLDGSNGMRTMSDSKSACAEIATFRGPVSLGSRRRKGVLRSRTQRRRRRSRSSAAVPIFRRYEVGDIIGEKYVLEALIGEGGMGTVWRARHGALDSTVAIKLVRHELGVDDAARRLQIEARACAGLEHRAIVRVLDMGTTATADPFIVMEFLTGETLGAYLQRVGPLDPRTAARILLPIVEGVAVAHDAGVIHRDLKPENIFLADDGARLQPKILDFGIARLDATSSSSRLTRQGTVLGSPLYMAPEQAAGLDADHRADIWTLTVVLYEAITGRPPFLGASMSAILRSVVTADAMPITESSVADRELWQILACGLNKDRDERWSSVRAFGRALALWLDEQGVDTDICGDNIAARWFDDSVQPRILPPVFGHLRAVSERRDDAADALGVAEAREFDGASDWRVRLRSGMRFRRRAMALSVLVGGILGALIAIQPLVFGSKKDLHQSAPSAIVATLGAPGDTPATALPTPLIIPAVITAAVTPSGRLPPVASKPHAAETREVSPIVDASSVRRARLNLAPIPAEEPSQRRASVESFSLPAR